MSSGRAGRRLVAVDDRIERATAEADAGDTAAQALLRGFGAVRTGGTVVLRRPGQAT